MKVTKTLLTNHGRRRSTGGNSVLPKLAVQWLNQVGLTVKCSEIANFGNTQTVNLSKKPSQ